MENELSAFRRTLSSSFVEADIASDARYAPRFLVNDKVSGSDVLTELKRELADCTSFDFSVAFITSGGIQILVELLADLERRGVPGRILTSTYLNFNSPAALRKLLEYGNIEQRIYQGSLHAKGYHFDREGLSTIIVGSSNLTQTALTCNKEWNILFRSYAGGGLYLDAKRQFEAVWEDPSSIEVTSDWIDRYESYRREAMPSARSSRPAFRLVPRQVLSYSSAPERIVPNAMQQQALEALDVLHRREERRALLISATGTGKTYLSAFDVLAMRPRRLLFVAHRERILRASRESFERLLGERYTYEIYGGGSSLPTATCVFAMVGTLSRHLGEFGPDSFDYLIIDEAHRTGAHSYQRILAHFVPRFCLGMTATPNRTDGYDVYSLFNHVIAYRITLQDALKNEMLAPFHYFGIADIEIDDQTVDDVSMFTRLTSDERVRHITSKIEEYSVQKAERRGLIFCNRNEEAARLSQLFNEAGYRTLAISGATSNDERDRAIARLESGELEYLFSVDILNEGVDIPSVNQIIMLRRTESAIVFVQQLGRGLRKVRGKEYTLVLDFIGNYQQNYLVPIALSGDRSYNKDTLRRFVKEGSVGMPGCSTIAFDRVSEKRIFKALEQGRFSEARLVRGEYEHLRQLLGRIPTLIEFDENESIDPLIIIKKYGSYAAFLERYEKSCPHRFGKSKLDALRFLSQKLGNGKRRADLLLLRDLVERAACETVGPSGAADDANAEAGPGGVVDSANAAAAGSGGMAVAACASRGPSRAAVAARASRGPSASVALPDRRGPRLMSVLRMLTGEYSSSGVPIVEVDGGRCRLDARFEADLADPQFRSSVLGLIDFALSRNERLYAAAYKDTDFVLYAKYTREEVCRLLRWTKEPNYQNIGGYFHDKETNTFPVFINYEKDPSTISITTMYEDRFVSDTELIAISKSKRTLRSPEIVNLAHAAENGMRCFLFVRKNKEDKDDGTEFYFLGEMRPTGEFRQIVMAGTTASAVEIGYHLDDPVRADLYEYLTSDLDA